MRNGVEWALPLRRHTGVRSFDEIQPDLGPVTSWNAAWEIRSKSGVQAKDLGQQGMARRRAKLRSDRTMLSMGKRESLRAKVRSTLPEWNSLPRLSSQWASIQGQPGGEPGTWAAAWHSLCSMGRVSVFEGAEVEGGTLALSLLFVEGGRTQERGTAYIRQTRNM